MNIEEINEISCQIIAFAGDGKSYALEAIDNAELGNFDEAEQLLNKCDESILKAHEIHTNLLVKEAQNPGCIQATMMLIHASNHLSNAEISRDLAERFINFYKKKGEKR